MNPKLYPLPTSKDILCLQLKINHQTKTFLPEDLKLSLGIRNPMQLISFLKSHEGKAMLSEIQSHIQLEEIEQQNLAFAREEYMHKLYRKLLDKLISRAHNKTHTRQQQQEAFEILQKLLLEENNINDYSHTKLDNAVLAQNHDLEQTYLDYLSKHDLITEELDHLENLKQFTNEVLNKLNKQKPNHHNHTQENEADLEKENTNILNSFKLELNKQIQELQQSLQQNTSAQYDRPHEIPTPKPRFNSNHAMQTKFKSQIQNLRATACRNMLESINKQVMPGIEPTADNVLLNRQNTLNSIQKYLPDSSIRAMQNQQSYYKQQLHELQQQKQHMISLKENKLFFMDQNTQKSNKSNKQNTSNKNTTTNIKPTR